jgi:Concanavalin A-like lectin/glucanases superfamily
VNWNQWNHVAIRFAGAGGNVSIYLNGTTTSCGNLALNTSAGNLTIGSNPSTANLFSGELDEFGLWNVDIANNAINFLPTLIYQRQNPVPIYSP